MFNFPIDRLIDSKTGIIRHYRHIPVLQKYPRLWVVFAKSCNAKDLGALNEPQSGGGIGITFENACYAALGEVVERYCGSFAPKNIIKEKGKNLSKLNFEPTIFNNMHSSQASGFSPLTMEGTTLWCVGTEAFEKEKSYAPWSLVCLGASSETRNDFEECYPGPSISTGLACGINKSSASLNAILECCERDSCMLAWYTLQFRGVVSEHIMKEKFPFVTAELKRCGLKATIIETTNDLEIPSFISVITDEVQNDRVAFGMSSALTPYRAAFRALLESIQTWMWADNSLDLSEPLMRDNIGIKFPDFESRVVAYGSGLMEKETRDFFSHVNKAKTITSLSNNPKFSSLDEVVTQLHEKNHPILLFDLTTDDVKEIGLHVMRAVCPTLQTMDAAHEYRVINTTRIKNKNQTCQCNTPHPFP